jgi:hypothetical protein
MKMILIGLFSMTVLVMCIAIIRVAVVSTKDTPSDISWLYFWSDIELTMGTSPFNQHLHLAKLTVSSSCCVKSCFFPSVVY